MTATEVPAWVERYRGRPFLRGSDGPEAFDCYGLVRAVLRDVWGASTPALDGAWHLDSAERLDAALEAPGSPWTAAEGQPLPGDVLTFHGPQAGSELHVAIVVADGWVLQARQGEGVHTSRFDRPPWALLRFGPPWRHVALLEARRD